MRSPKSDGPASYQSMWALLLPEKVQDYPGIPVGLGPKAPVKFEDGKPLFEGSIALGVIALVRNREEKRVGGLLACWFWADCFALPNLRGFGMTWALSARSLR